MVWIVVSVLGVLLMGASVLGVLLVVSPSVRMFCLGAVCMLGVVGVLLALYHQHTTQAPTTQARLEAVSTPEEAAQAVQRLRAAHDGGQPGHGAPPARAIPQAAVHPPPDTSASHHAPTVPGPGSPAGLASEDHDALALPDTPPAPAPLTPGGPPLPRVTVMPPSSLPPRATLAPPAVPTPSGPLTPHAIPTPSAPTGGSALKSCDALQAEIHAKLEANRLTGYTLTITPSGDLPGLQVVGSCEGNTKKIVLTRSRHAP
jgi:hypothetical protein